MNREDYVKLEGKQNLNKNFEAILNMNEEQNMLNSYSFFLDLYNSYINKQWNDICNNINKIQNKNKVFRICTRCHITKEIKDFHVTFSKNTSISHICEGCFKNKRKEDNKKYYKKNRQ